MTEAVRIGNATLYCGDCLDVLKTLPDASIEAIVTDPPYGLSDHKADDVIACLTAWIGGKSYKPKGRGFMGKAWDAWVPGPEVWREALRVLKPGGHILAFAGTRSMDLMSMAIRLAGFELRDSIGWAHDAGGAPLLAYVYGSGFPKSLDVSKALDKMAGAERDVVGPGRRHSSKRCAIAHGDTERLAGGVPDITLPATDAARQWSGWGTALKPAWEPIILARKPLDGTVAQNVLAHGTGGINIDGCRIGDDEIQVRLASRVDAGGHAFGCGGYGKSIVGHKNIGRFPANLIHDGSDEVVELFPETVPGKASNRGLQHSGRHGGFADIGPNEKTGTDTVRGHNDNGGSAARFFYCAKADQSDRDEGCDDLAHGVIARSCQAQAEAKRGNVVEAEEGAFNKARLARNHHPTVKPTDLMRYLCRLVTPPGGTILDPFMGSGSTGRGAALEGFHFIGIEREPDYLAIAEARIKAAQRQPDLFHTAVAA